MDAVVMLAVFAILASLALLVPFPLTDKANPSDTSKIRDWPKGGKPADAPY